MKWRNSKERELLSQGGTREQTLPSKDNQHPDLSDALDHQTLMESTVGKVSQHNYKEGLQKIWIIIINYKEGDNFQFLPIHSSFSSPMYLNKE